MRYSFAFEQLYRMSEETTLQTRVKYRRVAIFIGRIMMRDENLTNMAGITVTHTWQEEVKEFDREEVINAVVALTEAEWTKVREKMMEYADKSGGTDLWKRKRRGWVNALDTMRAFDKPGEET